MFFPLILLLLPFAGCKGKEHVADEPEIFAFAVYPGSRRGSIRVSTATPSSVEVKVIE